ncbi:DUF4159 domain-containing protein [Microvirga tunisiensis]|uniref:DUF4159 domain-containing protein n=1 Tax=Pannonibacter tanglangensis TaxID=2750084 RepID=A0A7X5EZ99_9HYPH|nr:DUF4159 domain-containing protein [Pannonibacter sp. XCT-53]NBN76865.1 DUF4159 domain-containing protein [Pannonibacter sp. XCT-53]
MFGLPLAFATPLILGALVLLPVIWWLLRFTPPRPREVTFPPTRLLVDIEKREETPQKSPWWLTLLRLLIAALLILALAGPQWRPADRIDLGSGPVLLLIDNGWTSATDWDRQVTAANGLLALAETAELPVILAATADGAGQPLAPAPADVAAERLRAMAPRPWDRQRAELVTALRKTVSETAPSRIVWISDGLEDPSAGAFQRDLSALAGDIPLTLYTNARTPLGIGGLVSTADALTATVIRKPEASSPDVVLRALDPKGLVLGEATARFEGGAASTEATFALPSELRNDIARLEIDGVRAAGAVKLIDDSWRRRTVGLISGAGADQAQPLLSPLYYLQRALAPFADLRVPRATDLSEAVPELLEQGVSVVVLADVGRLPDPAAEALDRWIRGGGLLVRFAGPRTAGGTDDLLPVALRAGDRTLGGSLSWEQPQKLAPFPPASPFAGLTVPEEVLVSRQVLAEPTADLPERSWALLTDGTPLVTAGRRGDGAVVLFHVTADTAWSNLPLSGVYVDMLRRIVASASAAAAAAPEAGEAASVEVSEGEVRAVLPPLRLLDGYGSFVPPRADVVPVAASGFASVTASRDTPPGLYGTEDGYRALNLLTGSETLTPLDVSALGEDLDTRPYLDAEPVDLRAGLFSAAFLLLMLDALIVLLMAGLVSRLRLARAAMTIALALCLTAAPAVLSGPGGAALAQTASGAGSSDDLWALEAATDTRLAYVITGNPEIDETSRAGLDGLSQYLAARTALEPGAPIGVDISRDELAFFALLYWPVDAAATKPDARTMARIDGFMRNGGTILFDTRDHITASATGFSGTPATLKLREILDGLDVPALEPVPADHVLTKAFFLLDSFPGRYATSPLWVEASEASPEGTDRPVRAGDGVSPIMITGNDFAAAWATDQSGNPLYPTVPDDPDQREYAYRSGVNIVMYSLTGNYKADQVHVPALLERLGQ